jgi:hypothetical protein
MRPDSMNQFRPFPAETPVHYRIEVYQFGGPPDEEPVPVSLCPYPGRSAGPLTDDAKLVTCSSCRRHLSEIGVAWQ